MGDWNLTDRCCLGWECWQNK